MKEPRTITHEDWFAELKSKYSTLDDVRFICPICKHVASVRDYKDAEAPESAWGRECIGNYTGANRKAFNHTGGGNNAPGPCDYKIWGLFKIFETQVLREGGHKTAVFETEK